jgi:hypothetical protein
MENLPKNVINKTMLFLSHPTADMVKGTYIFIYMALRIEHEHFSERGSPFRCGIVDTIWRHRFYDPRKYNRIDGSMIYSGVGQRFTHRTLWQKEHDEYAAAYLHFAPRMGTVFPDLIVEWRIHGNRFRWKANENETLELESGSESDSDSSENPTSESDSGAESGSS